VRRPYEIFASSLGHAVLHTFDFVQRSLVAIITHKTSQIAIIRIGPAGNTAGDAEALATVATRSLQVDPAVRHRRRRGSNRPR
jgi:hypothetical protein